MHGVQRLCPGGTTRAGEISLGKKARAGAADSPALVKQS